jgi:hypothetical protein
MHSFYSKTYASIKPKKTLFCNKKIKLCDEILEKNKGRKTVSTKIGKLLTMSYIKVLSVRKGCGGGGEAKLNVSKRHVL